MTLDKLLAKVPPEVRPVAARYGPALVKMTAEEFCAWLELLLTGRAEEAWRTVAGKLGDDDLLAAWANLSDRWDQANARNAERLALQRQAALAVLKVLLMASLAAVGL